MFTIGNSLITHFRQEGKYRPVVPLVRLFLCLLPVLVFVLTNIWWQVTWIFIGRQRRLRHHLEYHFHFLWWLIIFNWKYHSLRLPGFSLISCERLCDLEMLFWRATIHTNPMKWKNNMPLFWLVVTKFSAIFKFDLLSKNKKSCSYLSWSLHEVTIFIGRTQHVCYSIYLFSPRTYCPFSHSVEQLPNLTQDMMI